MIASSKPQASNLLIQNLRQVKQRSDRPISCAVFADDDPAILRWLGGAFLNESAAILPAPQHLWSKGIFAIQDAALWATEELAITSLVLVGNSAADVAASEPILAGQADLGEAEQGLLASVHTAAKKRRKAEQYFALQVQALLNLPEISSRLVRGSLTLHCLFYRAESGVFATYDPQEGSFRELVI